MSWQDFDLDGKLRVPLGYNLAILYLLRGYVLWIVSLTFSEDRALILSTIYPSQNLFFMTLLVGLPSLITFLLFSLKSQLDKRWYRFIWQKMRISLLLAFVVDILIQFWTLYHQALLLHSIQMIQLIVGSYLMWYWFTSKRIRRFFQDWLLQNEKAT